MLEMDIISSDEKVATPHLGDVVRSINENGIVKPSRLLHKIVQDRLAVRRLALIPNRALAESIELLLHCPRYGKRFR